MSCGLYGACEGVGCTRQQLEATRKRLTRRFRELKVASQQHQNVAKSNKWFASPAGGWYHCYITDEKTAFTKISLVSPRGSFELLCSPEYSADVPIKNAEKQIINPVSGSKLLGPRRIRFLFICCSFLKSRKYHLVSNSLTPFSSRFRSAYTRLLDSRGLTVPQPKTRFLRDAYQL